LHHAADLVLRARRLDGRAHHQADGARSAPHHADPRLARLGEEGHHMKREYPFPPYPNGWFQVAYADEVAPGQLVPLSYFGRELIVFRGTDGKPAVLDAFCP